MNRSNKIIVFIIDGCAGCQIIKDTLNNIKEEIKNICDVVFIPYNDVTFKEFIKLHKVSDFPTTFFIKNNEVLEKIEGTIPKYKLKDKINKYFNN